MVDPERFEWGSILIWSFMAQSTLLWSLHTYYALAQELFYTNLQQTLQ